VLVGCSWLTLGAPATNRLTTEILHRRDLYGRRVPEQGTLAHAKTALPRALALVGAVLLVVALTACDSAAPSWVEWMRLDDGQWTPFAGHTSLRACESSIGRGTTHHPDYRCLPVGVDPRGPGR
jgi:hypothetical protein